MVNYNPDRLTDTRPVQPPEGALIEQARLAAGLPFRAAADRAGISYNTWRAAETGFTMPGGGKYLPRRGTARNVAKMAAAVGVTAEQLDEAGRGDAADLLLESSSTAAAAASGVLLDFDKVELHVWQGPGTERERHAMIAAYRETRYRQWTEPAGAASEGELKAVS